MLEFLRKIRGDAVSRRRLPLDLEGGLLVGFFCAVYAAVVGGVRGISADMISLGAYLLLVCAFGIAGGVVGSVVLGRPDFGPTRRTAAVRGFVAAIPVYATGALLFLPVDRWFSLLPILSVVAAVIVGPPIGIFVYRTFRRRDIAETPVDASVELAWLKGEMIGGWTPLLVSIAVLASLGVGMRALPETVTVPSPPAPATFGEIHRSLPALRAAVTADSLDPGAHYRLGKTLLSVGEFDAAVAQLRRSTELDSSRVASWVALGRAAYYAGLPALSARAYWNVIRLDPTALAPDGLDRVLLDAALSSELSADSVQG